MFWDSLASTNVYAPKFRRLTNLNAVYDAIVTSNDISFGAQVSGWVVTRGRLGDCAERISVFSRILSRVELSQFIRLRLTAKTEIKTNITNRPWINSENGDELLLWDVVSHQNESTTWLDACLFIVPFLRYLSLWSEAETIFDSVKRTHCVDVAVCVTRMQRFHSAGETKLMDWIN